MLTKTCPKPQEIREASKETTDQVDNILFHVEQDVRDLQEDLEAAPIEISIVCKRLSKIADKLLWLQKG